MNFRFLFPFLKKDNPVLQILVDLKKDQIFRGARFDLYLPSKSPDRLIVLLGQMHTVFSGSISNKDRKKIVACQTRLLSYYQYFYRVLGITSFGSEGVYEGLFGGDDLRSFRLYEGLIARGIKDPQQMLSELGRLWQEELRSTSDITVLQNLAMAVNGQTLFDYLQEGKIKSFPIEGERQYRRVLDGITALGDQIRSFENSYEMRVVKQRGGKAIGDKEIQAVRQYNSLVKEFNDLIGSDIRERATLDILRTLSEKSQILVFTMGVAHRKNYLKTAPEFFCKTKTAFVFITPPELLPNWWFILGVPLLILLGLLGLLLL